MVLIRYMFEKFHYFDKPEGTDPVNKIMGLAKYGIATSGLCALYDACLYSKCKNTAQFLNTTAYWMIPVTGMCLTFSAVTYCLTNIRKKDDKLNYIVGAFSSGAVLHAWVKNPFYSGWGTFFLVLYAVLKKDIKQHNYKAHFSGVFVPKELPQKWYFPWRNVPYRNYTTKPRWEYVKDDYYKGFF